jgi:hypothetical protein
MQKRTEAGNSTTPREIKMSEEQEVETHIEEVAESANEGKEIADKAPKPEKEVEAKPVSTRDAIKNALKEAKEKDENPNKAAKTEHAKPVSAAKDAKTGTIEGADKLQPAAQGKPLEAPRSWPAADKAEFSKLPQSVRTRIIEREKSMEAAIGKAGQTAEYGNRIKETFTPYDAIITAEGGTHEKAIKELLNSAYILRRGTPIEKARMVADTMRRFGVDLRVLNGQPQQQPQARQPDVQELVRAELQKAQEQQQLTYAQREWQAFREDPAHPHCDLVAADMQAFLNSGRANGFQDAYEKAVWANPELRGALIEKSTEQKQADLKKANDAKRRAGLSLSGSPGKNSSPTVAAKPGKTTREDIANAMAQVRGGDF